MKVTVNLYAGLERYSPTDQRKGNIVEIEDSATINELLHRIGVPVEEVKLIMVNGRHQDLDYEMKNNDTVGLFPPIGGG